MLFSALWTTKLLAADKANKVNNTVDRGSGGGEGGEGRGGEGREGEGRD